MPKAAFSIAIDAWRFSASAAAELTDCGVLEFIFAEDHADFREQFQSLVAGGDARELRCELRFLKRDGTCTWSIAPW